MMERPFANRVFWGVVISLSTLFFSVQVHARHMGDEPVESNGNIRFTENKGQWHPHVNYKLRFKNGALFLEDNRFTYTFIEADDWQAIHDQHHGHGDDTATLHGHNFYVNFEGANPQPQLQGSQKYRDYANYFIGQDPDKWASGVNIYNKVTYNELYNGIDLNIYGKGDRLKYDVLVAPGADPSQFNMRYEGVDDVFIEDGKLHYLTSVNYIYEEEPYAYQLVNRQQVEVPCAFTLNDGVAGFTFPEGYDTTKPLVIDPTLVFSTFTGSLADNFGFTATYDNNGSLYAGGIARAAGYPTTSGAFQTTFAGGVAVGNFDIGFDADMSITKFTPDGSNLAYSTYLGGSTNDQPHSLVVNSAGELHIYGRTNSNDFPVTSGAYDPTYNDSMDIAVVKFNATGTNLVGSTFMGGSADDGANFSPGPFLSGTTKFNYADDSRGEIKVDAAGNVYVVSCTKSSNFPVTSGVIQNTLGGAQDACIFRMNSDLSNLDWSTYYGGVGDDAGYSLVIDNTNNIYFTGGTASFDLATTSGTVSPNFNGGVTDGFIARINSNATNLLAASFVGTNAYDQSFFVQLDGDNNVYLLGQSAGSIPVSSGVYSTAAGGQFIFSLQPDLTSYNFTTRFGTGNDNPDISPTAFLVDNCRNIYLSGWGGSTNFQGNVLGLPVTADAYQSSPDATGSDFYFMVLEPGAVALNYATFFGGPQSSEHVDGGTSRFDKNGVVYQAVCAGCGGNDDFPTTPGAWSNTNQSQNPQNNCNLGALKFQFEPNIVEVDVQASPSVSGCVPHTVQFNSDALNAQEFFWDFGNGDTSTQANPLYTFTQTGTFQVTLIGLDSTTCDGQLFADTSTISITVDDDSVDAGFDAQVLSACDSILVQFSNTSLNAQDYQWDFGDGNTSTQQNPTHQYDTAGTYTVTLFVENDTSCNGFDTLMQTFTFDGLLVADFLASDTSGCVPLTVDFTESTLGGQQFIWDFGVGSPLDTAFTPQHTYTDTGTFTVSLIVIDSNFCNASDTATINIQVIDDVVVADFVADIVLQNCDSLVVDFTDNSVDATQYFWDFGDGSTSTQQNPQHTYVGNGQWEVTFVAGNPNSCNLSDTATTQFEIQPPVEALFAPDSGCFPFTFTPANSSTNATAYNWQFHDGTTDTATSPVYTYDTVGDYNVTLVAGNPNSCNLTDTLVQTVSVHGYPEAFFTTDTNVYQMLDSVQFTDGSTDAVYWYYEFGDGNATDDTENPIHQYAFEGEYDPCLTVVNQYGCEDQYCDSLRITFRGLVDVPNAFSPNGDGMNDVLYVKGFGIENMVFRIYNRWGELVFESTNPDIGWDGTYKGKPQEMEVYVYTLEATFEDGTSTELKKGNITLLR